MKLDIKQEFLLPVPFRMAGFAIALIGCYLFVMRLIEVFTTGNLSWQLLAGIILVLLGIITATAHYRLGIDPEAKTYRIYIWLLGVKNGETSHYTQVERIYINDVIQGRRVQSWTGHQNEITEYLFKAYMKLDNGEKVHLDTDKNFERLDARVANYRIILSPLFDD